MNIPTYPSPQQTPANKHALTQSVDCAECGGEGGHYDARDIRLLRLLTINVCIELMHFYVWLVCEFKLYSTANYIRYFVIIFCI